VLGHSRVLGRKENWEKVAFGLPKEKRRSGAQGKTALSVEPGKAPPEAKRSGGRKHLKPKKRPAKEGMKGRIIRAVVGREGRGPKWRTVGSSKSEGGRVQKGEDRVKKRTPCWVRVGPKKDALRPEITRCGRKKAEFLKKRRAVKPNAEEGELPAPRERQGMLTSSEPRGKKSTMMEVWGKNFGSRECPPFEGVELSSKAKKKKKQLKVEW